MDALNNLRLIIQPLIFYCLIQPWLQNIPGMKRCFLKLINLMNDFQESPITFLSLVKLYLIFLFESNKRGLT